MLGMKEQKLIDISFSQQFLNKMIFIFYSNDKKVFPLYNENEEKVGEIKGVRENKLSCILFDDSIDPLLYTILATGEVNDFSETLNLKYTKFILMPKNF